MIYSAMNARGITWRVKGKGMWMLGSLFLEGMLLEDNGLDGTPYISYLRAV